MSDDLDMGETIRGFRPGQRVFNRYELVRQLGRGGMGVVWLAQDSELDTQVALKFLSEIVAIDAVAIDELKRETRRSRKLTHPNIVRIHDFLRDGRSAAISMEYVDGETLSVARLEQPGKVFEAAALSPWVKQLCGALDYAHREAEVAHRDLKPANLMITDGRGTLKVMDFGISAAISDTTTHVSRHAGSSGTPVYMSPQQMMGEKPSVTDDVYSMGATLYELLTGKPPFYTGNIALQVQSKTPPRISQRRTELLGSEVPKMTPIPEVWETTIAACLAKEPEQRPQSAAEVWARLDKAEAGVPKPASVPVPAAINSPSQVQAQTATSTAPRKSRTRLWVALSVIALSCAAIAAVVLWQKNVAIVPLSQPVAAPTAAVSRQDTKPSGIVPSSLQPSSKPTPQPPPIAQVPPAITAQPINVTITSGQAAAFSVGASIGDVAPSYAWQYSTNGSSIWTDVSDAAPYSGANTNKLAITNVAYRNTGCRYRCVVRNSAGEAISASATLTVKPVPPAIVTQAVNSTIASGQVATFTVEAAAGDVTPSYTWQYSTNESTTWTDVPNTAPYSGVNASKLTITNAAYRDNGNKYRCAVRNSVGEIISNPVTLTVTPVPPAIATQATNVTEPSGQTASFIIEAAAGDVAPTYTWQYSTNGGTTWTDVPGTATYGGSRTNKLTISNIAYRETGYKYRCIVKNPSGEVISNTVMLTVKPVAPAVIMQAANATATVGQTATFTVKTTAGDVAPTYTWQYSTNGGTTWTDVPGAVPYSGNCTNTLTITDAPASFNGHRYRCVVRNPSGEVASAPATFTVKAVPPTITTQPDSATIIVGETASFIVGATAVDAAPSYTWQYCTNGGSAWTDVPNAAPYSDAHTNKLTITDAPFSLNGYRYRCAVSSSYDNTAYTNNALLTLTFPSSPSNEIVTIKFLPGRNGAPSSAVRLEVRPVGGARKDNIIDNIKYLIGTPVVLPQGCKPGAYEVEITRTGGYKSFRGKITINEYEASLSIPFERNVSGF